MSVIGEIQRERTLLPPSFCLFVLKVLARYGHYLDLASYKLTVCIAWPFCYVCLCTCDENVYYIAHTWNCTWLYYVRGSAILLCLVPLVISYVALVWTIGHKVCVCVCV